MIASLAAGKEDAAGRGATSLDEAGVGRIEVHLSRVGKKYLKKRAGSDAERTKLGARDHRHRHV